MEVNRILKIAQKAGQIILENGGEIYRVEETISKICSAYGINSVDSFVTPTVIMISLEHNDDTPITLIKRIKSRTVDFCKIEEVNSLSRQLMAEQLSLDYVEKQLDEMESIPKYSNLQTILASGLTAGAFTLFFGGSFIDFFPSAIIGFLIRIIVLKLSTISVNDFFINIVGGALATFMALLCYKLSITSHPNEIIIGSIMLLVPGLAITNGIRDTIAGDLFSGLTRTIEAFFVAIAIAIGSAIIFKLYFIIFGGII